MNGPNTKSNYQMDGGDKVNTYKKCPFCGGNAELNKKTACYGHGDYAKEFKMRCKKCGAKGPTFSNWDHSEKDCKSLAETAWNNRAP